MPWIVANIQDGECHYIHNYLNDVIEKNRDKEKEQIEKLNKKFVEIEMMSNPGKYGRK